MRIDRSILAEVARLKLATPGVAAGKQHGDRHSPFLGRGMEFADYRPYGPGDDLRLVDWNVYARLEAVLIRLFHEDRNLTVQVCIDASGSMRYGTPRKIDHAGALGATLALIALKGRDEVRIGCAGGAGPITLVRGQNQTSFGRVLQYLEMVEAQGSGDLERALRSQVSWGKPDVLFFLSDMLVEEKQTDRLLRTLCASARQPVLLHVLSEEELHPDLRHPQRVVDEETGKELRIVGGRAAAQAYQKELSEYLTDLKTRCRALQIQYIQAFTDMAVSFLLNTALRRVRVVESASGAAR
ncbi:MAG: DUF58 domain-containing protein [Bradymonadales bacterium]|nr:DUF58 domain-containing protein [Bradymonadales bacterium]